MVLFTTDKKEVDGGQFPIEQLQELSRNTKAIVAIKDYAVIVDGVASFYKSRWDFRVALQEARQKIKKEVKNDRFK